MFSRVRSPTSGSNTVVIRTVSQTALISSDCPCLRELRDAVLNGPGDGLRFQCASQFGNQDLQNAGVLDVFDGKVDQGIDLARQHVCVPAHLLRR